MSKCRTTSSRSLKSEEATRLPLRGRLFSRWLSHANRIGTNTACSAMVIFALSLVGYPQDAALQQAGVLPKACRAFASANALAMEQYDGDGRHCEPEVLDAGEAPHDRFPR